MAAVRIHTTVRSTTLELPELARFIGRRVEVVVSEENEATWPDGWFEGTAGAIPDFVRPAQPAAEERPGFAAPQR
ncbi:MAG: hypothetical protein HYZ29_14400 [Myxococcales bacterium]|nr:hypothetical protein [Myxococcales bacterium]